MKIRSRPEPPKVPVIPWTPENRDTLREELGRLIHLNTQDEVVQWTLDFVITLKDMVQPE